MNNDASKWTLDPGHSSIAFSVRHLMITNVRGLFSRYRADVTYDPAHPEATRIDATIDVDSIDTREAKRDVDLRSELFFDAAHHPHATFVSKSARKVAGDALEIDGELTIRGKTLPATLAVTDIGPVTKDMRGNDRVGATATTKIKRADYGISWNKALDNGGVVVGEVVTITLDIQLLKAA